MPKIRYIMLHYALLCLFLKNHYAFARGGIKCSFLCRHNSPMAIAWYNFLCFIDDRENRNCW